MVRRAAVLASLCVVIALGYWAQFVRSPAAKDEPSISARRSPILRGLTTLPVSNPVHGRFHPRVAASSELAELAERAPGTLPAEILARVRSAAISRPGAERTQERIAALLWSDASAEPELWLEALAASREAFEADPGSVVACDNRASALDAIGLEYMALEVGLECHALEPTGPFSEKRLRRLVPLAKKVRRAREGSSLSTAEIRPSELRDRLRDALIDWGRQRLDSGSGTEDGFPFPPVDPSTGVMYPLARAIEAGRGEAARDHELDRLAGMLVRHGEGLRHAGEARHARAERAFVAAARQAEALGMAFAGWPWVEAGVSAYFGQRFDASMAHLARARAHASQDRVLRARILWIEGLIHRVRFRPSMAEASYEAAMALYAELGDEDHHGFLKSNQASVAYDLGDHRRSWQLRFQALASLDEQEPLRLFAMLGNAAEVAMRTSKPRQALDFLLEAEHRLAFEPRGLGHLLNSERLARLLAELDEPELAREQLERAESLIGEAPDDGQRERVAISLRHAHASLAAAEGDLELALEKLAGVLEYHRAAGLGLDAADLRLERARWLVRAGRAEEAALELEIGLDALEAGRKTLKRDQLPVYFERTRALFDQRLELVMDEQGMVAEGQLRRGDPWQLLLWAERSRARTLRESRAGSGEPDLVRLRARAEALDPRLRIVQFAVLPEQTLILVLRAGELHAHRTRLERASLDRRVTDWLENGLDSAEGRHRAAALYRLLLAPVLGTTDSESASIEDLVVVPDGPLHRLPFAFLRPSAEARPLLYQARITIAPSTEVLLGLLDPPTEFAPPESLLALAWGEVDTERHPDLWRLPMADREAQQIAELYPAKTLRTGHEATVDAFLREIRGHDVVHFTGHAIADPITGGGSRLLLSPAAAGPYADGELQADVLADQDLAGLRLAVLSACSTARGGPPLRDDLIGLVGPFLGAGVPTVVASLWPVADRATSGLMADFHGYLRAGSSPAEALRKAQIDLLDAPDPGLARAHHAAAFQVYGRYF